MPEADVALHAKIRSYLDASLTEDMLYEKLADSAGLGADEIDKASFGKTFFSRIWIQQKERVCANQAIILFIQNPSISDATVIATQVLNLLSPIPGINMILVSCLAVRIGLRQLCAEKST